MDHPTFGRWLKLRRGGLGLTQAQLGEQIGYAGETIRKVEADELRPSKQMTEKLATALKIAPEERTAFIRFARDEGVVEAIPLPVQVMPPPPAAAAAPATSQSRQPALPLPRNPLIGREWEIKVLQTLLLRPTVGLVTLTGPGGVGKTRLALQLAANLRDQAHPNAEPVFPDGVYFVPLAAIDDPALVLSAIAQLFSAHAAEGVSLLAALQEALRTRQVLLVLDNFEQVVGAASLLSDLLQAAPQLKILVTSRTVLHLRDEHHFAVPPLALPTHGEPPPLSQQTGAAPDAAGLMQSPAVRFFVARAQAAHAGFAVTSQNIVAISQICQQLEGLPLAIELAAARARLLPPQAMLARLDNQLKFLTGGAHDLPARQQTMRATLAWSYDLLSAAEKCLFRRMALLVAGGTFEAIESICNADGALPVDALECLASLIDKSLLQQKGNDQGEGRFIALRVIREYALERLMESGEAETIRQQQAAFYLAFVETAEPALVGDDQQRWLERVAEEYDNLRALLEWALGEGDSNVGLRIAGALRRFWQIRGYYHEALRWLTALLAKATAWTPARIKALNDAGFFAGQQGDNETARRYLAECLAIGRQSGDQAGIAKALHGLGIIASQQGDYLAATTAFEESLLIRRMLNDKSGMNDTLNNLGVIAFEQGDYTQARQYFEESLVLKREAGNQWSIAIALNNLGSIALNQGDYAAARQMHGESLALRRNINDKKGIASSLTNLGNVSIHQGDYHAAHSLLEESLALHQEIGDKPGVALVLNNLGGVAYRQGDYSLAQQLCRESLRLLNEMGDKHIAWCLLGLARVAQLTHHWVRATHLLSATAAQLSMLGIQFETLDRSEYEHTEAALRAELTEAQFAQAWAAGQAWRFEQMVAYALSTTDESA